MNRVVLIEHSVQGDFSTDRTKLASKVREEVEFQNGEGYKVQSITPITANEQTTTSDDYPYVEQFIAGMLIIFEQIEA